jgi:hypothetical protein
MAAVELNARTLMAIALQENDRRFAGYDPRLVRPTTMPRLARFILAVTRPFVRKKKPTAPAQPAEPSGWRSGPQSS